MAIHPPTAAEQVAAKSAALVKLAGVQSQLTPDGVTLAIAGTAVAPATSQGPGAQAALDKAKQDTQSTGGWLAKMANRIGVIAPGISEIIECPLTYAGTYPTGLLEGDDDGGSAIVNGSLYLSGYFKNNPYTSPWAVAFRAKFVVPVTGKHTILAAYTDNGLVQLVSAYDTSVSARTHLYFSTGGPGSLSSTFEGPVIDGEWHDHIIAFDGVQVKLDYDCSNTWGTLVATSGNFPQIPARVIADSTAGFNFRLKRVAYAV